MIEDLRSAIEALERVAQQAREHAADTPELAHLAHYLEALTASDGPLWRRYWTLAYLLVE